MGCFMRSQLRQTGARTITDCKPFSLSHMECSMRSQQQKLQAALFKPRGVLSEFPSTPSGLTHRQTASRCLQAAQIPIYTKRVDPPSDRKLLSSSRTKCSMSSHLHQAG
ncbi:hypothetical protein ISCGN_032144 [Ixodes scapularis]